MTHAAINHSLLALGLILQCSLLALLFTRRLARSLPIFTLLIAFYLLRSVLLLTLFGHIDSDFYAVTYNTLAAVDLVLQLLLAVEIAARLVRAAGGWATHRGALLTLPCLALVATLWLTQALPAQTRVPPDRLQLFNWFLAVLLCLWAISLRKTAPAATLLLRRLLLGLGAYAFLGIGATILRTLAAANRDALRFTRFSYILPIAWLLVVLYWIAALKPQPNRPAQLTAPPVPTA
jgi:hypothetical protein